MTCLGPLSCAGTGQDGDKKTGVPWPKPRFVTSGDCVTDNLTGLMWVKAPEKTKVTWAKALADSNDMDLCGSTDWRLSEPTRTRLESLINAEVPDTAVWLNTQQFTNVQPDQYWASTSSPYPPGPVIGVSAIDMRHGDVHRGGPRQLCLAGTQRTHRLNCKAPRYRPDYQLRSRR